MSSRKQRETGLSMTSGKNWMKILIGPYSEERHKIVDLFVKSYSSHSPSDIDNNLCLQFFNRFLDKSFQSFNLTGGIRYHPFEHFGAISLLSVISQRSPDLKSLTLSFKEVTTQDIAALCTSLKSFKLLTSFSFSSKGPTLHVTIDFLPLFSSLGATYQKLISLELKCHYNSQKLNMDYLLALVLGKNKAFFLSSSMIS